MEEKGEETGDRVAELEEAEEKCEGLMTPYNSSTEGNGKGKVTAGRISSEDRYTVTDIEIQHGTEGEETSRQLMDYVQENRSLQRTDTRRTRIIRWEMCRI